MLFPFFRQKEWNGMNKGGRLHRIKDEDEEYHHCLFQGKVILCCLFLLESYLFLMVMEQWIEKSIWTSCLAICGIHSIIEDDVMVRVFLQNLVAPTYDWYFSLPTVQSHLLLILKMNFWIDILILWHLIHFSQNSCKFTCKRKRKYKTS